MALRWQNYKAHFYTQGNHCLRNWDIRTHSEKYLNLIGLYTAQRNITHSMEFDGNQGKHHNLDPNGPLKKMCFLIPRILNIFSKISGIDPWVSKIN